MSVEVRPLGVACNLACRYCYQEPVRDAGNISTRYDLNKIIEQLDRVNTHFHLFGGEPLLIPKTDLEALWKYGYEKFGQNAIQTNATLIDDDHIELFKKYNVAVGVSIDGPNELNDLRWAGSPESTRDHTQRVMDNIRKMAANGVKVGVIITLHRLNGTKEKLPRLINFINWLADLGIVGGNIHTLEVDNIFVAKKYCLSVEEEIEAFMTLAEFFESRKDLSWLPFSDMKRMLSGDEEKTTCYWHHCDPLNTQCVYGIEGNGALSNCGRTNKDGIDLYKADGHGYERYIALYHTPQELGGCAGCRFWAICGGACPGESVDGDWRNKTSHCAMMKHMLTYYEGVLEEQGIRPISKHPLLKDAEEYILQNMMDGKQIRLSEAIKHVEEHPTCLRVYKEGVRVL